MGSFYAQRSQTRKKDSQLKQLFALLGSMGVKVAHAHVDEIDLLFLMWEESKCLMCEKWNNSQLEKTLLS